MSIHPQLAVTVGHNILRLEQSASTTAKAGKGPDVEEQEREAEEEQPGISPRRRRGRPGSSDADDDKKEGAAVLDNGGSSSLSVPVGAYAYERGAVSSTSGSAKWASDSARGAGTSKGAVAGLVSLLSSSPTKEQRGRPVHASPRRRPRASGPSSHRSLAAVEGATAASDSPSRPLRALTTIYEVAFRARGPTIAGSSPAAGEEEEWGAEREDEEDAHTRGGGTSALESTTAAVVQETLGVSLAPPSVSPAASAAAFSSSGGLGGKQMRRAAAGAGAGGDGGVAPSHGGARGPSPTAALLYRLPRAIRSLFSPVHGGGGDAGAGPYAGFQSEVSSLTDDQSYRSSVSWAPRSLLGRRLPPPLPSSGGKGVLPDHVVAPVDAHGAATPVAVAGKEAADEGAGSEGGAEDREVAPLSLSLGPQGGAAGAAAGKQSVAAVSVSTEGSVSSGGRSIVTESEWRAWREDKSV